jgi:hypothetical protein
MAKLPKETQQMELGYGAVEGGLVRTYDIPTKARGAFRGRLGNLQKRGLFGGKNMPGKGVALSYGPDQLHRLIFACELFELGVTPADVLRLVKFAWERRLRKIFDEAAARRHPGLDDVVIHLGGVRLMTSEWSNATTAVPNINACPLSKLPEYMKAWMMMGPDDPSGLPPRALVVNLSARLRSLHAALDEVHARERQ